MIILIKVKQKNTADIRNVRCKKIIKSHIILFIKLRKYCISSISFHNFQSLSVFIKLKGSLFAPLLLAP